MQKNDLIWSISLMVISCGTIVIAGSNIIGIELSDVVGRIIGFVDIIALPILAYSTVKTLRKN